MFLKPEYVFFVMAAKTSVEIKNEIEFTRSLLCPNYLPLQDLQMLIKKLSELFHANATCAKSKCILKCDNVVCLM